MISRLRWFALATACRAVRLPGGSDQAICPADGGFYFRAFDGSVTLPAAGYDYGGNWAISTDRTLTCWSTS